MLTGLKIAETYFPLIRLEGGGENNDKQQRQTGDKAQFPIHIYAISYIMCIHVVGG